MAAPFRRPAVQSPTEVAGARAGMVAAISGKEQHYGGGARDMNDHHRPRVFERIRRLPGIGRAADWGLGPSAVSKNTKEAGARIAGLKATESVCPYCAVGCGQ